MHTGNDEIFWTRDPGPRQERAAPVRPGSKTPGPLEKRTRVVVADDHEALRHCLCRLIAEQPGLEVVGQAVNGQEAVHLARELGPDLVLMDVNMPHVNGVEATQQITRDLPAIRVLAMSADWSRTTVATMLRAGASGCVSKTGAFDVLLEAIETVSAGGTLSDRLCFCR